MTPPIEPLPVAESRGLVPSRPVAANGRGEIAVTLAPNRSSVVTRAYASSPLRLLMPRNHGHAAWVYLSTYGGGLVGGDHVRLDVRVAQDATLYLSTQSSTKVYRSPLGTEHEVRARVLRGATFISIPDPVVCFSGSRHRQVQSIHLEPEASLVLVDWMASGRLASGERWRFDEYCSRLSVHLDGTPVLHDVTAVRSADGDLARRMGRFNVIATIMLAGPAVEAQVRSVLAQVDRLPVERGAVRVSASRVGDRGCLVRIAGGSIAEVTREVRRYVPVLPDLLGDDPWARKW